jgi:hypothetical protein
MTKFNWSRPAAVAAVAVALTALAGCGPSRVTVSGDVAYEGQPVDDGAVVFVPEGGGADATQVGASIHDGKYTIDEARGLRPGKYKVQITWMRKTGKKFQGADGVEDEKVQVLPPKFNTETTQTAEVKRGKNTINFQLTK